MSTYVDKPLSLIEKKKLQWAKEKEELASLCAPWSSQEVVHNTEKPFNRNRYVPKLAMANTELFRKEYPLASSRRSSLPPLYKNQYNSVDRDLGNGGETSGYGSDNPIQPWIQSGYESSSSYKDDRLKWKDKTKFWDSSESDPPNWVKRGLQTDEEIVVTNTSPAESPQQDDLLESERPYTSTSSLNKTYIRGQNIPLDSLELAERERRRQIALAHQEAVRQQLEEREKRRLEEKQKRIREELEEELRIEREQEVERQRKEREFRIQQDKMERERKRNEAIQEALEIAEKEAKLEKIKQKMQKQTSLICSEPETIPMNENIASNVVIHNKIEKEKFEEEVKKINNNSCNEEQVRGEDRKQSEVMVEKKQETAPASEDKNDENKPPTSSSSSVNNINSNFQVLTPRSDVAFVLQSPLDSLKNIQYVLMPINQNLPYAIPLTPAATPRTENRILTPTQLRLKNKTFSDSSTQTDSPESNNNKLVREKLTNLELNYDNSGSCRATKERRNRSEERVEDRPKWGANRPPTRYLKQSEKDPLYQQRRKLRQKQREYKNSSDESQAGSPRSSYRKRHARALWRKSDRFFAHNVRMYQTEIVPLESDKEQIYYKCECCCRCSCSGGRSRSEVLKIEHNNSSSSLPDCNSGSAIENANYIIDKLASLHNGLLLKQEQWERSPRTPSLSSSTRNTENL